MPVGVAEPTRPPKMTLARCDGELARIGKRLATKPTQAERERWLLEADRLLDVRLLLVTVDTAT